MQPGHMSEVQQMGTYCRRRTGVNLTHDASLVRRCTTPASVGPRSGLVRWYSTS